MMDTFERFLKKKKFAIICAEKSKILVFNRRGREEKDIWNCEGKVLHQVYRNLSIYVSYLIKMEIISDISMNQAGKVELRLERYEVWVKECVKMILKEGGCYLNISYKVLWVMV